MVLRASVWVRDVVLGPVCVVVEMACGVGEVRGLFIRLEVGECSREAGLVGLEEEGKREHGIVTDVEVLHVVVKVVG